MKPIPKHLTNSRQVTLKPETIKKIANLANPLFSDQLPSVLIAWYNTKSDIEIFAFSDVLFGFMGTDYEIGQQFMTLSGHTGHITPDLASDIYRLAQNRQCKKLSFLPKDAARAIAASTPGNYEILPDSNSDYVYKTSEQTTLTGGHFKDRRWTNRQFEKLYKDRIKIVFSNDHAEVCSSEVSHLFDDWNAFGTQGASHNDAEKYAFNQFRTNSLIIAGTDLVIAKMYIGGKLVAFCVLERVGKNGSSCHFSKCNLNISYANDYLFWCVNQFLFSEQRYILNFHEDADIPGLEQYKLRLRPSEVVSKYFLDIV